MATATKTNDVVLEINNISVSFDGFYALTEVRTKVMRNSIHFFIGPNGAGKTTLLDIICAKTKPTSGTVIFHPKGREAVRLTGMKEYKIVREGGKKVSGAVSVRKPHSGGEHDTLPKGSQGHT